VVVAKPVLFEAQLLDDAVVSAVVLAVVEGTADIEVESITTRLVREFGTIISSHHHCHHLYYKYSLHFGCFTFSTLCGHFIQSLQCLLVINTE
jgi:hypothetical protein